MGADTYPVLQHSVLSGLVKLFRQDPESMLGKMIFKSKPVMETRTVGVDIITNPRHLARYRHVDAPSEKQALKVIAHKDMPLLTVKESKPLPESLFSELRRPGTDHQAYAKQIVVEELEGLDIIIENLMEKSRWDLIQTGIISQTSTGVDDLGFTLDFGIDSDLTPTLLTTDKWSDATNSDPMKNVTEWMDSYERISGVRPRFGFCSRTVINYLIRAAKMQTFMSDVMKDEIWKTGSFPGFAGLERVYIYGAGYVPEGGSFTPFLGADKFVLWSGNPHKEYLGIFNDKKARERRLPGKFSKTWDDEDPSVTNILLGACHLPSGERIKEFFCADVA